MAEALRQELLAVPGIAGAEVESDRGVAGVRVQLATGADPDTVGAAVRRILSQHGMRSVAAEAGEQTTGGPPPPPGAPGSVVSFPLVGERARTEMIGDAKVVAEGRLESVAVEETPEGITVSVRCSDGRRADRTLQSRVSGMDEAVVAAVAELTDRASASLVEIGEQLLGGRTVVTVLLGIGDEQHVAGAVIQLGGRAYAVAGAAWIALTAQG